MDGGAVMLRTPAHVDSRTELLCISPQWPSTAGMFATFSVEEAGARVPRAAGGDAFFRWAMGFQWQDSQCPPVVGVIRA